MGGIGNWWQCQWCHHLGMTVAQRWHRSHWWHWWLRWHRGGIGGIGSIDGIGGMGGSEVALVA